MSPFRVRDSYVVVGASAGGYTALRRILLDLPEDFPGALLIVVHVGDKSGNWLAEGLGRVGRLPVQDARSGEPIRQGNVYVVPAGYPLEVRRKRISLGKGPLEQYFRPSIDVLFRTAAKEFGPRVIGVILSGRLRDGTVGLQAVHDAGGITVVQNPDGAEAADMPRNAMKDLAVNYCLELPEIGPVLELLVRRGGEHKSGDLETGLASSLRLMQLRAKLLSRLVKQSSRNPRTEKFLKSEVIALNHDIDRVRRMILS